ncbi:hypothetical protein GCM10020366_35390 [Saccharopolyspora gregorii]|uniref:Uncharacterized protein n=1 Tax=Saccharopolyspora gregorii TaxID=33914 RepID=A0ABP6RRL9_9PSEU
MPSSRDAVSSSNIVFAASATGSAVLTGLHHLVLTEQSVIARSVGGGGRDVNPPRRGSRRSAARRSGGAEESEVDGGVPSAEITTTSGTRWFRYSPGSRDPAAEQDEPQHKQ